MSQYSIWGSPSKPFTPHSDSKDVKISNGFGFSSDMDSPTYSNKAFTGWNVNGNGSTKAQNKLTTDIHRISLSHLTNGSLPMTSKDLLPAAASDGTHEDFLTRYAQLKEIEQYKNKLIEELLFRYEFLTEQYSHLSAETERDREYNHTNARREKMYQENIRRLQLLLDSDPFVLLLLDGNATMFHDELLQMGELGGKEAAIMLHEAVLSHVLQNLPDLPTDIRVVVRIFANVNSLAEKCFKMGVVDHPSKINLFVKGFGSSQHPLFDFVDVNEDANQVAAKISATIKLHRSDFHCRQLIVSGSNDEEYARLLQELATDSQVLDRISVLDGAGLCRGTENLPFTKACFDDLLRAVSPASFSNSPVTNGFHLSAMRPVNSHMSQMSLKDVKEFTPAGALPSARAASISTTDSPKASPGTAWATIAAKAAQIAAPPTPVAVTSVISSNQVPRNRKGQRVDPQIKHDKVEVDRVKKLKMCNVHYLRNECPYGDGCTHIHTYKPSSGEIQTLRLVARMAPCMSGSECEDVKCIYGHICPAPEGRDGKDCIFGDSCRFPPEMHKLDRQVVKTIKV